jgi:catechol 2,3-dioxygenase-like lactoylglutathione lyase family enzyme
VPFEQLDFLYVPSRDVKADLAFFRDVLGARVVFAVEGMGTRVAAIELSEAPPQILLAGHLEGEAPIFVYRVKALDTELARLESRGWTREATFEIPPGPVCSFRSPGGQRLAIYERSRPDVMAHFVGRHDF